MSPSRRVRLLTSAATVQRFKARTLARGILSTNNTRKVWPPNEQIDDSHFVVWVILATVPCFIVTALVPLDREFGKKG